MKKSGHLPMDVGESIRLNVKDEAGDNTPASANREGESTPSVTMRIYHNDVITYAVCGDSGVEGKSVCDCFSRGVILRFGGAVFDLGVKSSDDSCAGLFMVVWRTRVGTESTLAGPLGLLLWGHG